VKAQRDADAITIEKFKNIMTVYAISPSYSSKTMF